MLKTRLSKSLRIIADILDSLDEGELEALVAGKARLVFAASEPSAEMVELPYSDSEAVMKKLQACKDRQAARSVLSEIASKDALTSVAKAQKIHVAKHDRRDDIENKIIEFVIGGRLRSEAIQTLNLNGAGKANNGSHEAI